MESRFVLVRRETFSIKARFYGIRRVGEEEYGQVEINNRANSKEYR